MRQRTVIIFIIWFVVSLMYYGLTLNTGEMSGNIYLNTFLSGAVEIPANFLCIVLLNWEKTGRRYTTAGSGVLAGVSSFLCVPFIMSGRGWQATLLAMLGKGFVTICFNAIYVFSAEIFPTELRNAAMGVSSGCARLSSMAAPFLGKPLTRLSKPLPYIIFGALSTMAGFLALFLPETLNAKLCDTVEEAESFMGWDRQRPSDMGTTKDSESYLTPVAAQSEVAVLKPVEPSSPSSEEIPIPQSTHTINVLPATDDDTNTISI